MDIFISEALAQDAAGGGASIFVQLLPLIAIFAIFYFLLIRPQQKRMKDHKAMQSGVRRGDRIVTGGGIIGSVVRTADDELTVEIAEGVRVKVLRTTISHVLAKTEPARGRRDRDTGGDDAGPGDGEDEESAAEPKGEEQRRGLGRFVSRR